MHISTMHTSSHRPRNPMETARAAYIDQAEANAWEELENEHQACARWRNLHVEGCRKDAAARWDDARRVWDAAWSAHPGDTSDKREAAFDAVVMSDLADCDDLAEAFWRMA